VVKACRSKAQYDPIYPFHERGIGIPPHLLAPEPSLEQ
jgi:hypothetical protein